MSKNNAVVVLFNINGIAGSSGPQEWLDYYIEVLKRIRSKIGKQRPQMWSDERLVHPRLAHMAFLSSSL
ncbi:hypothetical protein TNCV_451711 [Trichonephila clavipes]|nr:hypothetical protein TNCV_451711 [Trichonephila clavipes]